MISVKSCQSDGENRVENLGNESLNQPSHDLFCSFSLQHNTQFDQCYFREIPKNTQSF